MMFKNKKTIHTACVFFIIAEICLSFLIQATSNCTEGLQFASVALACVFCFLSIGKGKSYIFTQAGLIATVFADFFLVVLSPRNQLGGMICFSFAQIFYFLRLYSEDRSSKSRSIHLTVRAILSATAIVATALVLGENTDALAVVSVFYYANLILNVIFSFAVPKSFTIFVIGLICFVLCDTIIGLTNIAPYLPAVGDFVSDLLSTLEFDPAWMFYVPSQTLIAMSVLPKITKE